MERYWRKRISKLSSTVHKLNSGGFPKKLNPKRMERLNEKCNSGCNKK